jgi:anaerobic selenocysteine-containing dehydrogenase
MPKTLPENAEIHRSYCRLCYNACDMEVTVVDGVVDSVRGHPDNPVYQGFTCLKGRVQPKLLRDPGRLLHSQRRLPGGMREPVALAEAVADIARRLTAIVETHGPDSVAFYTGTMGTNGVVGRGMSNALRLAIGSRMVFSPATVDKAGKQVAAALHGRWAAPVAGYTEPEIAILMGINPLVSYQGAARGNPGKWLRAQADRGMHLVVIDPRKTETARRADTFLQARPGHDTALLASILRVILAEDLHDHDFAARHVEGVETLRAAVARFDPTTVAELADVDVDALVETARRFGRSRRGYVSVGTGPNMSGPGTLVEYLALCLDTLCGHVAREGEIVANAPTLLPAGTYRAQMNPPWPGSGLEPRMPAAGLSASAAGPPIAGLPQEMAAGNVRALFSCGGNPASAWPGQRDVVDALSGLDLLVQIDPFLSNTARLAHYVIAPMMPLEVAEMTQHLDLMSSLSIGYGLADAYAQYTRPVVAPPEGSEVVDEWQFFYEVGRAMGLQLKLPRPGAAPYPLDMEHPPTTDELLDLLAEGSRVPLERVRATGGGALHPAPECRVLPADPGWTGRADVANGQMLAELAEVRLSLPDARFDLRLIPRRVQHVFNSSHHHASTAHGGPANSAYLHPDDLADRGLAADDEVVIESGVGRLRTTVKADAGLRRGVVSMTHCYGGLPDEGTQIGANLGLIVGLDDLQPHTGQPVMSNIPVAVARADARANS